MSSAIPSNQKKIIIIGPAHPLRGGLASYNERLAKEFSSQGHQVSIYTFSLQYPGFLFPGTTQFSTEPAPADIHIKVCINSVNPFNWISVGNELKKMRPDIIIVRYWLPFMGPCLGTILRKVKKNKHTKIVCIADNIIPHEKRIGDEAFTKYFVKPIDAFITMSEKVLKDLQLFAPTKPAKFVAHPLYDNFGEKISKADARKHLAIGNEQKIILFFGFIRKYKGLDILLDAVAKLQMADCKLLIAGEFYEDRKTYDEQIERLGIKGDLILRTDFIPDSEVKYYLCAADVVVQPYRNATQSGVTPLAYHFEKPMIVTNVGGLPSLVPDDKVGLIAEPNAESIAEKIKEYFDKGEAHFLPHLVEEKKKYSWAKMSGSIIEIAAINS
ncbi:glycosyltransferase [Ferruginibacter lapsinanis]|uniref:glycosyltransferase n=1 Tax=Ferruginibacter lapsinanis TaxID=563172 RepID=UPI001E2A1856|nr:glycosyltransferase [Ferruginibacter lapsinanis]UEG49518.1 glycosyltransferase [Ferruginibacter lapsinanis]